MFKFLTLPISSNPCHRCSTYAKRIGVIRTDRSPASLTREVFQHLRCTIYHRSYRLIVHVGVWNLTVRLWASRQLSSELSDGWRVQILHVRVEFSSHPFYVVSLSRSTSSRRILSSRDATAMIWMFPVFTTSCSVTLAFSCLNGMLDNTVFAGKFTRMRPSVAVVEDSVGSTSVSQFQERSRQPFVARDLEFYHQLLQRTRPRALLETVATWKIHLRVDEQTRAHMLSRSQRLRLCLWSVRLQASTPSVSSEDPSVSNIHK